MEHDEALALIRGGVAAKGGTWADLGAGTGVFTRALSELLGPAGLIHAVDRDPRSLRRGLQASSAEGARILTRQADFSQPLGFEGLDGILMANALHFVRDHAEVLSHLAGSLRAGGSFLLVEYDLAVGTPWIPYPVPPEAFVRLAEASGLTRPREIGRRRSRYGPRHIYAAVASKG